MTKYFGLAFMGFGLLWLLVSGGIALASGPVEAAAGPAPAFAWLGGAFVAVGLLLFLLGLLLNRAGRQRKALIDSSGVSVQGTVNLVDLNYGVMVNNRPVYSIVEFTFTDWQSVEQRVRKTRLNSKLVTHSGIAPGSRVEVKYLMKNPHRCGLVLTDTTTGQTELAV